MIWFLLFLFPRRLAAGGLNLISVSINYRCLAETKQSIPTTRNSNSNMQSIDTIKGLHWDSPLALRSWLKWMRDLCLILIFTCWSETSISSSSFRLPGKECLLSSSVQESFFRSDNGHTRSHGIVWKCRVFVFLCNRCLSGVADRGWSTTKYDGKHFSLRVVRRTKRDGDPVRIAYWINQPFKKRVICSNESERKYTD